MIQTHMSTLMILLKCWNEIYAPRTWLMIFFYSDVTTRISCARCPSYMLIPSSRIRAPIPHSLPVNMLPIFLTYTTHAMQYTRTTYKYTNIHKTIYIKSEFIILFICLSLLFLVARDPQWYVRESVHVHESSKLYRYKRHKLSSRVKCVHNWICVLLGIEFSFVIYRNCKRKTVSEYTAKHYTVLIYDHRLERDNQ